MRLRRRIYGLVIASGSIADRLDDGKIFRRAVASAIEDVREPGVCFAVDYKSTLSCIGIAYGHLRCRLRE